MKNATVTEAHALQQQGHTYVDVRSSYEYAMGHPEGAVNVPLIERDERTGQGTPNADFVRVMQANFAPDAKLLLGCQAGGRSARAAMVLESFGYKDVTNVVGGFGGARPDRGWVEAGLPVSDAAPAGSSYDELVAKADSKT